MFQMLTGNQSGEDVRSVVAKLIATIRQPQMKLVMFFSSKKNMTSKKWRKSSKNTCPMFMSLAVHPPVNSATRVLPKAVSPP